MCQVTSATGSLWEIETELYFQWNYGVRGKRQTTAEYFLTLKFRFFQFNITTSV